MIYLRFISKQINNRAFTVVELLVVISIVSILLAMLLPSLKQARESAILLKCSAQTRSIALGTGAYSVDHKNQLPPNIGYNPGSDVPYQGTKNPGGYWWYRIGGGMQRAALLWPGYVTDSEAFYCPSTTGYASNPAYQTYHHNWATAGVGTAAGPLAAITSYTYPAVAYPTTQTNYVGPWTGVHDQYWSTPNAFGYWAFWSEAMLKYRVEENAPSTPLSWDLNQGDLEMHGGNSASVAFIDGSAIPFHKVRYLNSALVFTFGIGMDHPDILKTLQAYRERSVLP